MFLSCCCCGCCVRFFSLFKLFVVAAVLVLFMFCCVVHNSPTSLNASPFWFWGAFVLVFGWEGLGWCGGLSGPTSPNFPLFLVILSWVRGCVAFVIQGLGWCGALWAPHHLLLLFAFLLVGVWVFLCLLLRNPSLKNNWFCFRGYFQLRVTKNPGRWAIVR